MDNKVDASQIHESSIYEGGALSQINANDLKDNVVAIKQLINNHLIVATQSKQKDLQIQEFKSTIDYLKSSPFIAIIASVVSLAGTILVGLAVKLYTQENTPNYAWIILLLGIILNLTGALSNILYPYARKWFNKQKQ